MDLLLGLTGTLNGSCLAATGNGRLDTPANRCVLEIDSPSAPLRCDAAFALPSWLDLALTASSEVCELPIAASGFLLVHDDQGREIGRVSSAAYSLRDGASVRVKAQAEGGCFRLEVLERIVRIDPPQHGDVLHFGWGCSVVTSTWTLGSSRGSEYQAVSTTVIDWPADPPEADRLGPRFDSATYDQEGARLRLSLS